MLRALPAPRSRRHQRGLSIVETLVGVAVGLFVVAAAALLTSTQLTDNRRLLLETQIQQDLRATADIIARELRRSGALQDGAAVNLTWRPGFTPQVNTAAGNLYPAAGTADSRTSYQYQRLSIGGTTDYGFRLEGGRIRSLIGGSWQDLTDRTVMEVTTFRVTTTGSTAEVLPCPNDCPGGGTACWPTVQVRDLEILIEGRSVADPAVTRSVRAAVRQRADLVTRAAGIVNGLCPA